MTHATKNRLKITHPGNDILRVIDDYRVRVGKVFDELACCTLKISVRFAFVIPTDFVNVSRPYTGIVSLKHFFELAPNRTNRTL